MNKFLTKFFRRDFLAIIFLILCSFIFLSNLFLQNQLYAGQDMGQGDITHLVYPIENFYSQQLKEGKLPLWMDSMFMGYPLYAESGVGALFIPNIVIYGLFESSNAFNLSYLITFIIASTGAFFYARSKKLSTFASLFCSIVYSFNFVLIGHIIHPNLLHVIILFPWLVLAADKFFTTGSRIYWLIFTVIFSQMVLAGFPQCLLYSGLAVFFIMFLQYRKSPKFISRFFLFFLAYIFVLGLVALQLLPTIELYNQSTRSGASIDQSQFPFILKDLAYFISPYFWGDPSRATYIRNPFVEGLLWENNIYAGIIPFALLILSFFLIRKNKTVRIYIILFFLSLALSLGWLFFMNWLPVFSGFRLPQRALFLTAFSYAVLAGFGFERVILYIKKKISKKTIIYFISIGLIVITFSDIFFNAYGYHGGFDKKEWLKAPDTAEFLKKENISGRIFSLGAVENWHYVYNNVSHGWRGEDGKKLLATRALLSADVSTLHDISSFDGYAIFNTQNFALAKQLSLQEDTLNNGAVEISTTSAKLLGMYGVEYIVSWWDIEPKIDDLALVWEAYNPQAQSTYMIYKNKQFLPRVRSVAEVQSVSSVQDMVNDLLNPGFDPKKTAYIYGMETSFPFSDKVSIKVISEDNQELNFLTDSQKNSFVVVADSYYPGWKVTIDGRESAIYQTNINTRGINIPAGKHNIRMFYDPDSFKTGKLISFISILVGVAMLFWPFFKKLKIS